MINGDWVSRFFGPDKMRILDLVSEIWTCDLMNVNEHFTTVLGLYITRAFPQDTVVKSKLSEITGEFMTGKRIEKIKKSKQNLHFSNRINFIKRSILYSYTCWTNKLNACVPGVKVNLYLQHYNTGTAKSIAVVGG